jgi:hypothetical protein
MKLKALLLLSILSGSLRAEELDIATKKAFAEHYRKLTNMRLEFPKQLDVNVIFLETNTERRKIAIATYIGSSYEDGWLWSIFSTSEKGKWVPLLMDRGNSDTETGKPAFIIAGFDEFYRLNKKDESLDVLIIRTLYSKGADPVSTATKITFDKEGILKSYKVSLPTKEELKNYEQLKVEVIGA